MMVFWWIGVPHAALAILVAIVSYRIVDPELEQDASSSVKTLDATDLPTSNRQTRLETGLG